ncbi:MAG: CopG family transcriptional regulator [Ignavibacteriales bacterium CG07_land_8_20_14_0_80_59_12]|jgi:CopG family transcriptional regulator/antitoxin EndoAI|nr:MAG: CopG family transcriptional regulator [Ignavibacteriales bacterium CG07_land_8_20_14_0_80_59_12]
MRQSKVVSVSIPPRLLREAEKLAQREQRTKSELVRDALRLYLNLQSDKGFRLAVQQRARALQIESENDIERLVDEVRK